MMAVNDPLSVYDRLLNYYIGVTGASYQSLGVILVIMLAPSDCLPYTNVLVELSVIKGRSRLGYHARRAKIDKLSLT